MEINLVSRKNQVGLQADVAILTELLEKEGHYVHFHDIWQQPERTFQVNLFVELLSYDWIKAGKKNLILPNPECFPDFLSRHLEHTETILCKTRSSYLYSFQEWPKREFLGFTSRDLYDPSVEKDYTSCLHVMGKSRMKGTEILLKAWEQHPDLPPLTIVSSLPDFYPAKKMPKGVEWIDRYMEEEELKQLMNQKGLHLCPSIAEGWGHYIHEGMSTEAVVITTQGPPMNEFIDESCGALILLREHDPCALLNRGLACFVSPESIADAVRSVLSKTEQEKAALGKKARERYLNNHKAFCQRLTKTFQNLSQELGGSAP